MIKIKSLQKKILKIMIPIFLMIFSFIFIPGVKAEEFTYTYHDRNYIFHDTGIDEYIENVNYDTINQVFYDKYGHYIEDDDYVDSFFLYYSNDNKINSKLFFFKSTEFSFEGQKTSGISIFFYYDSNYGVNQVSISLKSNVDNKADYMHFKNVDLDLSKYTYSGHGSITSDVSTNFELHNLTRNLTEDVNIYYYTNANIPIIDSTHIVAYTNENKDSIGPKFYEFNEDIVVTDMSKIKVKFNLPEDTSNLYLNLDFSVNGLNNNVGVIGAPYISLTSKDEESNIYSNIIDFDYGVEQKQKIISSMCDIVSCKSIFDNDYNGDFKACIRNLEEISSTDINKSKLIREELEIWYVDEYVDLLYDYALSLVDKSYLSNINYSDSFNLSLLPDSTVYEYTFEVDVYNYEGSINLNFISNLNYEIEYEYKTEIDDYITTVNMKNYSALILIPKVKNLETGALTSIQSDIYLSGIYDIELWEDVESKNVLYRKSNYNYNVFSHYQNYHYLNAVLYFINKNIGDGSYYITFDSRYYNYTVKEYLAEEVEIINPNTNENIIIGDISDLFEYGTSENNKFTFNSFLKPIKFVFESISNFYNNYCPTIVQQFFYLIFMFFVVLIVIKIFL